MFRPAALRDFSDAMAVRWLRVRGTVLLLAGRLLDDEFMKLAGRFDLWEARRRPVPGPMPRRGLPR